VLRDLEVYIGLFILAALVILVMKMLMLKRSIRDYIEQKLIELKNKFVWNGII